MTLSRLVVVPCGGGLVVYKTGRYLLSLEIYHFSQAQEVYHQRRDEGKRRRTATADITLRVTAICPLVYL